MLYGWIPVSRSCLVRRLYSGLRCLRPPPCRHTGPSGSSAWSCRRGSSRGTGWRRSWGRWGWRWWSRWFCRCAGWCEPGWPCWWRRRAASRPGTPAPSPPPCASPFAPTSAASSGLRACWPTSPGRHSWMRLGRRDLRRKLKTFGTDSRSGASFIIRTNGRKLRGYFCARLGSYQSDWNRDRRILSNLTSGLISGKQSQNMFFSWEIHAWFGFGVFISSDLIYFFFVVSFF